MEQTVIGRGGMTAAEFDAATPREVVWRIEGLRDREERDWQRTAQLAAWVFGMVGSKVTANQLLGKDDA